MVEKKRVREWSHSSGALTILWQKSSCDWLLREIKVEFRAAFAAEDQQHQMCLGIPPQRPHAACEVPPSPRIGLNRQLLPRTTCSQPRHLAIQYSLGLRRAVCSRITTWTTHNNKPGIKEMCSSAKWQRQLQTLPPHLACCRHLHFHNTRPI